MNHVKLNRPEHGKYGLLLSLERLYVVVILALL